MQRFFLKKQVFFLTIFLVVIIAGLSFFQEDKGEEKSTDSSLKITSSELGIASPSPVGVSGGLVIPASCPSDLHDALWYGSACVTVPNVCGQTNRGILQCDGSCSVYAPPPVSSCPPVTASISGASWISYGDVTLLLMTGSSYATSCIFDDGELHPKMPKAPWDSISTAPLFEAKTYRFSCENVYSASGWKEHTVNVCPIDKPTWNFAAGECTSADLKPTVFLSVSPSHVSYDAPDSGRFTYSWNSSKADSCTYRFDFGPPTDTPPNTEGSHIVDYTRSAFGILSPDERDLDMTITCFSPFGSAEASAKPEFCPWYDPFWNGSECVSGDLVPTVTLSLSKSVILKGESSMLSWSSTDAASCHLKGEIWSTSEIILDKEVNVNGTLLTSPTDDADYEIECWNHSHTFPATDRARLRVSEVTLPDPWANFTTSPGYSDRIPYNTATHLRADSDAATECHLRYYDYVGSMIITSITPNRVVEIDTGNLTANRNYSFQCNNDAGIYTPWESVYIALAPQTATIAITPGYSDSIPHGGASSIRVTSTNTSVCSFGYYDYSGVWIVSSVTPNTTVDIATGNLSATRTYNFRCDRSYTDVGSWIPLTVNVGPKATLALCTEFGLTPFAVAGDTPSRNLYPNLSERLKAFYDTDPTDCGGTGGIGIGSEVTSTWAEPNPANPAVSISGNGTTPQVITAGPTPGLTENVTITQGTDSITLHYNIQPPPCILDCSDKVNICEGVTFNDANACGTNNCTGTRSCDYNWKETSP